MISLNSLRDQVHSRLRRANYFGAPGEAEREGDLLLVAVLRLDRAVLITQGERLIDLEMAQRVLAATERRASGEPLAYITGERGFYGHQFSVGPGVLIPRPETEHVVDRALSLFNDRDAVLRVADFGAGSGCIGAAILLARPRATLTAVERSPLAMQYLVKNLTELGLSGRAAVIAADVTEAELNGPYDLIVANPPYIAADDPGVADDVRRFEPHEALFADDSGLGLIKCWLILASHYLVPRGYVLMELGANQGTAVRGLPFAEWGLELIGIDQDLAGRPRVVVARKRAP